MREAPAGSLELGSGAAPAVKPAHADAPRPEPAPESEGGAAPAVKVSLFLGAGASTNYLMPTTRELKEDLAKDYAGDEKGAGGGKDGVWSDLLSDSNGLDIEHILMLADTIDRLNETEAGKKLIEGSGRFGLQLKEAMRLGRVARREVFRRYSWDYDIGDGVRDILGPLVKMARGMGGNGRVAIFTTNYDRAVEEFCEGAKLRLHDGFRLNRRTGRRMWTGNFGYDKGGAGRGGAVRLYKLHGSLDWKRSPRHGILRVDYDGDSDGVRYENIVIHPSLADKSKENERDPYKAIHDSFREELESSDVCVVVGFSFRDDPIVVEFRRFAELDGRTLIVVGPKAGEDVHARILERDAPDRDGQADEKIPVLLSTGRGRGRSRGRRAIAIRTELTRNTTGEIAARARGIIEARHGLRPVHTHGECVECEERLTIDEMEKHVAEHHHWPAADGAAAQLLRIVEYATGTPWMLAAARPDAALADLEKTLEEKWIPRYHSDTQGGAVRFDAPSRPGDLDGGTALSDVHWDEVTVWCSMERLEVSAAGSLPAGELRREPAKALAMAEKHPYVQM